MTEICALLFWIMWPLGGYLMWAFCDATCKKLWRTRWLPARIFLCAAWPLLVLASVSPADAIKRQNGE